MTCSTFLLLLFFGDNIHIAGYQSTATGPIESESKTLQEAKIDQSRPAPGECSGKGRNSHRTFYLKLSIMSWKRLPPPVVSAAAAAEVEGPPAPPLQLSCSFRSLQPKEKIKIEKRTDWERAREISCHRFKTVRRNRIRIRNDLYGFGSGSGSGSFHQQGRETLISTVFVTS
jgi:hypothetical protein